MHIPSLQWAICGFALLCLHVHTFLQKLAEIEQEVMSRARVPNPAPPNTFEVSELSG